MFRHGDFFEASNKNMNVYESLNIEGQRLEFSSSLFGLVLSKSLKKRGV